jgi:hypothetical protein
MVTRPKQTEVRSSTTVDDQLSSLAAESAITLQDDLNQLRTQILNLLGIDFTAWNEDVSGYTLTELKAAGLNGTEIAQALYSSTVDLPENIIPDDIARDAEVAAGIAAHAAENLNVHGVQKIIDGYKEVALPIRENSGVAVNATQYTIQSPFPIYVGELPSEDPNVFVQLFDDNIPQTQLGILVTDILDSGAVASVIGNGWEYNPTLILDAAPNQIINVRCGIRKYLDDLPKDFLLRIAEYVTGSVDPDVEAAILAITGNAAITDPVPASRNLISLEIKTISNESLIGGLDTRLTSAESAITTVDSALTTHSAESAIHFAESAINHSNIQNIGTLTHDELDAHAAESTIHFLQTEIDHTNLQNVGVKTHSEIDDHIFATNNPHGVGIIDFNPDDIIDHINLGSHIISINRLPSELITCDEARAIIEDLIGQVSESTISHLNIRDIGCYSHAVLDAHVESAAIHYPMSAISHLNISNVGTMTHPEIETEFGVIRNRLLHAFGEIHENEVDIRVNADNIGYDGNVEEWLGSANGIQTVFSIPSVIPNLLTDGYVQVDLLIDDEVQSEQYGIIPSTDPWVPGVVRYDPVANTIEFPSPPEETSEPKVVVPEVQESLNERVYNIETGSLDSRYYTRTEIDNTFYTKTDIDNNFYNKTESDARYYTQTQINTNFYTKAEVDQNISDAVTIDDSGFSANGILAVGDTQLQQLFNRINGAIYIDSDGKIKIITQS